MSSAPFVSPTITLARLGPRHGYRFDGDTVHLHATFDVRDRRVEHRMWALQLWACPSAPAHGDSLVGHLVGQAVIPSFAEADDEIEVSVPAHCPAGEFDYSMVAVLAASRAGRFDEVHDVVAYPARERFVLPRLVGTVGYRIEGYRAHVNVAAIENPRPAGNLSGTLALELWALPAPYSGGAFEGVALAGGAIESIAGGNSREDIALDMPYTPPPIGTWQVVLMLREWTGVGYTTRDFTNFAVPLEVSATPPPPVEKPVAKISVPLPAAGVTKPAPATPPIPAAKPTPPPSAIAPQHKPVEKTIVQPTVPTKAPASSSKVSVNTATAAELAGVKGLTKPIIAGIVAGRPFKSLDDLTSVKGLGEKTLAKIRAKLAL